MDCLLRHRSLALYLALMAGSTIPGVALSADNGAYVGAATSNVSSDYGAPFGAGPVQDDDGLKLIAGFRPVDAFAIEANYADFGTTRASLNVACVTTPCPQEIAIDSRALSVSAVGLFTLPLVDLYARAGVARWESERRVLSLSQKSADTDPTYGAGLQLRLGSFALRVEYERFELGDESVDLRSVGFTYTFL
ncbi:MAG TPA: outer membrane beta-barrel protein [Gammaproteobacteria bacterium]|nr:outer membrane beta-barrel protein [Gammaproteobacteria bacterium]